MYMYIYIHIFIHIHHVVYGVYVWYMQKHYPAQLPWSLPGSPESGSGEAPAETCQAWDQDFIHTEKEC